MLNLNVINQSKIKISKRFISTWIKKMQELFPLKLQQQLAGKNLNVVFLDQAKAKKLNLSFRQKDYATDILSFDPIENDDLGELVICPQVIRRQAKEHGLSFQQELGYMLIHGCLHLLGYDHEGDKKEAKRMFRLQDKIFSQMR